MKTQKHRNRTAATLCLALCAALLAAMLAGCGGGGAGTATQAATEAAATTAATTAAATTAAAATEAETEPEPAGKYDSHQEITFYFWGEKPNQMDEIAAHFNETGGKDLNMTWKTNWTPLDDFANMIKLKLSAGEPVDACFDAQWMNMLEFIRSDTYRDLTPYFNNPEYPGLDYAFDANFLSNNPFGTGKNYGVPITQAYGTAPLVLIRGDLREQYGVPVVNSLDDYRVFLQAIVDNEPNMIPLTTNTKERHTDTIARYEHDLWSYDRMKAGIWGSLRISGEMSATVYVQDYKIVACVLSEDGAGADAEYPAPYKKRDTDLNNARLAREFFEKGYLDQDFINVTSMSGIFTSGKGASLIWDTANYISLVNTLMLAVPDAFVEVYQPSNIFRDGVKGKLNGEYQAWNFVCVPVTTPQDKFERIMSFYDWIFSSWDNHDLIELGIPGKNFEAVGETQFRIPDGVDPATNYNLPGYQLLWNAKFIRLSADIPDNVVLYNQRGNDPETYYNPLFSGFAFDPEGLENEIANPDYATFKAYSDNIRWGIIPDVEDAYVKLDEEIAANKTLMEDLDKIRAEFVRQAQEYLDERKVTDANNRTVY